MLSSHRSQRQVKLQFIYLPILPLFPRLSVTVIAIHNDGHPQFYFIDVRH